MKNIKPSPANGKRFILLSFLSLFIFCVSIVSAQDNDRRQVSSAEQQTENGQMRDAEIVFKQNRFAEASEDATSKTRIDEFSMTRFDNENHGIIEVLVVKTTTETGASETKHEVFGAPQIKPNSVHQSKIDIKTKDLHPDGENSPFTPQSANAVRLGKNKEFSGDPKSLDLSKSSDIEGFRWRPAIQQALLFLAVQHGYAMTQPKTREALKGRFFHDYIESVKSLHGWEDGGKFFTNYIAHPMQGSFVGFIQIHNDPKGMKQRFSGSGDYWRSRMKAMAWSAAWSTQFEIGPLSQASIGNVGLKGKQTYVDLVMTPTLGAAMLITEDALDRFVIERIERGTNNFYLRIFSRMLLNPTRTVANLIRFKHPWHRDRARAR
jgi:hypothetical protein